jgi:hypothetical protein
MLINFSGASPVTKMVTYPSKKDISLNKNIVYPPVDELFFAGLRPGVAT